MKTNKTPEPVRSLTANSHGELLEKFKLYQPNHPPR
jgi:hypothetical protein